MQPNTCAQYPHYLNLSQYSNRQMWTTQDSWEICETTYYLNATQQATQAYIGWFHMETAQSTNTAVLATSTPQQPILQLQSQQYNTAISRMGRYVRYQAKEEQFWLRRPYTVQSGGVMKGLFRTNRSGPMIGGDLATTTFHRKSWLSCYGPQSHDCLHYLQRNQSTRSAPVTMEFRLELLLRLQLQCHHIVLTQWTMYPQTCMQVPCSGNTTTTTLQRNYIVNCGVWYQTKSMTLLHNYNESCKSNSLSSTGDVITVLPDTIVPFLSSLDAYGEQLSIGIL